MPNPVLEIERKGSGRKKSIRGMSNVIHEEVMNQSRHSIHSDKKSENNVENDFENFKANKRASVLKLNIEVDEPKYEESPQKDIPSPEDVEFSPNE
jgi:hypothetical protein